MPQDPLSRGTSGAPNPPHRRGSIIWPVLLITLGVMLLAQEFLPSWDLTRTWPLLLVVIGVLMLIQSGRPPRPPEGPRL
jgi:hypothetical protein